MTTTLVGLSQMYEERDMQQWTPARCRQNYDRCIYQMRLANDRGDIRTADEMLALAKYWNAAELRAHRRSTTWWRRLWRWLERIHGTTHHGI